MLQGVHHIAVRSNAAIAVASSQRVRLTCGPDHLQYIIADLKQIGNTHKVRNAHSAAQFGRRSGDDLCTPMYEEISLAATVYTLPCSPSMWAT